MSLIIPPDFPVGILIGKLGANIRDVQAQSGAKVYIDSLNMTVKFKGTPTEVQIARNMIERQIHKKRKPHLLVIDFSPKNTTHKVTAHKDTAHKDTALKDTAHKDTAHKDTALKEKLYLHPCFAAIVLSPNFEDTVTNSPNIRFKYVHTPKDIAHDHKEQLYRLDLNAPTEDELAELDELTTNFRHLLNSGYTDKKKKIFYARNSDWGKVMSAYQNAANIAANEPGFCLKLRIHFGTQLFYTRDKAMRNVSQSYRILTLSDILGLPIGPKHNLQACYSNEVSSTTIDRMRRFLPKLGFTPSLVSDAIFCRGKNMTKTQDLNFKFDVGDDEEGNRQIQCTEIRSKYIRIINVGFVYPAVIKNNTDDSDQGPDFRCRVLGEYLISEKKRKNLMSLAEGCTWSEVTKKVKSNLGEFELTRYKKKELFTGEFKSIKVEVGLVNVTDDSGWHWEMEVTSPDCDANPTDRDRLDELLTFCDQLRTEAIK